MKPVHFDPQEHDRNQKEKYMAHPFTRQIRSSDSNKIAVYQIFSSAALVTLKSLNGTSLKSP